MKRLAIACAFFAAAACHAAGPFDGIYKHPLKPDTYLSIHQNGAHIIVAGFETMPMPQGTLLGITYDGGSTYLRPSKIPFWGLSSGDAFGNYVRMQGEDGFGGCQSIGDMWLNPDGSLTMRLVAIGPTAAGAAQRIGCLPITTGTIVVPRVF